MWLPKSQIEEINSQEAQKLFQVNVFGYLYGMKGAISQMKKQMGGVIVNICSTTAFDGMNGSSGSIYVASKYAIRGLTNSVRDELKDKSISIIGVYPGGMKTHLFDAQKPENFEKFMPVEFVAEKIIQNLEKNEPDIELVIKTINMSAHKNFFQTSDFITYTIIIVALILEWFFPTDLNISKNIAISIGIFVMILSWLIIFTSKHQFKKNNQKSGPNNETITIIKTGLFSYTRNPIYLGVIFIAPALGFIFDSIWLILAIIPVSTLIHFLLIIPEEKYLKNKFGTEYDDYYRKVRRWF